MKKFRVKRLKFNWLTAIALVLVAVTVSAVLVNISDGFDKDFADWSFREVNEENLYQTLTFAGGEDGIIANGENGVGIDLLDDNVIKVKGTADSTKTYVVGSTTLKAGQTYVFDSSLTDGSSGTVYMSIRNTTTDEVIVSSYRGAVMVPAQAAISQSVDGETVTVTDVPVTIEITIVKDAILSETLKPILCIGTETDDAVKFYK